MSLEGKVAIVTGASRGIGRAIALSLAQNGAHVAALARSSHLLQALVQEIETAGGVALPLSADVTVPSDVEATVAQVLARYGRVDILVNNAGFQVSGPLHTFAVKDFDRVLDINLKGVFLCMRAVLPAMIERKSGHIINIASVSGLRCWGEDGVYTASKWAVLGLAESIDEETRRHGIKVSSICPGAVETDMLGDEWLPADDPRRPLVLQPQDVANAVLYVAAQPPNVVVNQLVVRPVVETLYSDFLPAR